MMMKKKIGNMRMNGKMSESLLYREICKIVDAAEQAGWDGHGGDYSPYVKKVLNKVYQDFPIRKGTIITKDNAMSKLIEVAKWMQKWFGDLK